MIRGLYTAAAGMIMQQRKHDQITNNIANINTPGFKKADSAARTFPEFFLQRINDDPKSPEPKNPIIGSLSTGVFLEEAVPHFLQGDLQETGNALDMALVSNLQVPGITFDPSGQHVDAGGKVTFQPQAFFTVVNEKNEERYTRNGKFSVDPNGNLVTGEGYKVVNQNNEPITFANTTGAAASDIVVDKFGALYSKNNTQPMVDQNGNPVVIKVSKITDPNNLVREGNGLYKYEGTVQPTALTQGEAFEVHQGFIERSNVDASQSTIDLMSAVRAYEANQKVIQFYDKILDKAVNEVGRV